MQRSANIANGFFALCFLALAPFGPRAEGAGVPVPTIMSVPCEVQYRVTNYQVAPGKSWAEAQTVVVDGVEQHSDSRFSVAGTWTFMNSEGGWRLDGTEIIQREFETIDQGEITYATDGRTAMRVGGASTRAPQVGLLSPNSHFSTDQVRLSYPMLGLSLPGWDSGTLPDPIDDIFIAENLVSDPADATRLWRSERKPGSVVEATTSSDGTLLAVVWTRTPQSDVRFEYRTSILATRVIDGYQVPWKVHHEWSINGKTTASLDLEVVGARLLKSGETAPRPVFPAIGAETIVINHD